MHKQLRRCIDCGIYTFKEQCSKCNKKSTLAHPAKFSIDDKYLMHRTIDKYI